MSEIKVDTLTGKTTANDITVTVGATATQSLEQGLAKAWMSLDSSGGSTTGINDSLNTASVLDDGVGQYGQNFTNAMSGATYSTVSASRDNAYHNVVTNWDAGITNGYSTTRSGIANLASNTGSYTDADVSTNILGDLA